jgi:hypothetical protein
VPAETLINAKPDSVDSDSPSVDETDTRHKPVSNKAPLVIPVQRRSHEDLKGEAHYRPIRAPSLLPSLDVTASQKHHANWT